MKKQFKLVLACLAIMMLVLSACSLEMLEGNKFIEWGLVEVDTSHANAATAIVDNTQNDKPENVNDAVSPGSTEDTNKVDLGAFSSLESVTGAIGKLGNLGSGSGSGSGSDSGTDTDTSTVTVEISSTRADSIKENGILAAQSTTEKEQLNATLSQALSGTANRDAFASQMTQTATKQQSEAAKNSMAIVSSLLESVIPSDSTSEDESSPVNEVLNSLSSLTTQLKEKSNSDETLTKAEVLQVQMITNLVTSAAQVANDMNDENVTTDNVTDLMNNDNVKSLISDATLLSQTTKALSGDVDLVTVPGITDFLTTMMNSSSDSGNTAGSVSRSIVSRTTGDGVDESGETGEDWIYKDENNNWRLRDVVDADMLHYGELQSIINISKNLLSHVFGITINSNGTVTAVSNYSAKNNAFSNLSTSYDVLLSVTTGNLEQISKDRYEYSFINRMTPGAALDYILATVVSTINDILADSTLAGDPTTLLDVVRQFVELNKDWIGRDIKEGDVIYFPESVVTKFKLNEIDKSEEYYKNVLGKKADNLLTKANVLDKMMAIGGFKLSSILGLFKTGSSTTENPDDTMYNMLYNAFVDMGIKEKRN